MARASRPSSALMNPAIAVSRKTGAMASWMTWVMSSKAGMARLRPLARLHPGPHDRHQAHDDDADDDQGEVALDPRDVAEEEAGVAERAHPQHRAHDVEHGEARGLHGAQARDERDVGAHDRQEARDHHRLAAVLLVERMRGLEVLGVQPAAALVDEETLAQPAAARVVDQVAGDGR